LSCAEFIIEMK